MSGVRSCWVGGNLSRPNRKRIAAPKALLRLLFFPRGSLFPVQKESQKARGKPVQSFFLQNTVFITSFFHCFQTLHVFLKFRHSESEIRSPQAAAALPPLSFGATTGYPETRSEPTAWLKAGRGKRLTQGGGSTHQLGSLHIAPSPQLRPPAVGIETRQRRGSWQGHQRQHPTKSLSTTALPGPGRAP